MIWMPITGISMGIFGGKGIPFFDFGTIPGVAKPIPVVAKYSFKAHKFVGQTM